MSSEHKFLSYIEKRLKSSQSLYKANSMPEDCDYGLATKCTHYGRKSKEHYNSINPPITAASTYLFESYEHFKNQDAPLRYAVDDGSVIHNHLRQLVNSIDRGYNCWLYPNGLNAITTALMGFVKAGDHVLLADNVYQPTKIFFSEILESFGIQIDVYEPTISVEKLAKLIKTNTKVLFTEIPGSNTMELPDIPAFSKLAHEHDITVICDNTWAALSYYDSFKHGVDVVIYAASKFISGGSNCVAGIVSCKDRKSWQAIYRVSQSLGISMDAYTVDTLLKSLRHFPVRIKHHYEAGHVMAEWLEQQEPIQQVLMPSLPSHPQYEIWKRDFTGAAPLFSIVLKEGIKEDQVAKFVNSLEFFGIGYSWGGFESLIVPFNASKIREYGWARNQHTLRVYIGLEDVEDLKKDLKRAMRYLVNDE